MAVGKTYRVKIVSAGQEFEAEGDKAFVLEMLRRFDPSALEVTADRGEKKGSAKQSPSLVTPPKGKAVSIREFVQQLGFKKHTDITLAFGYYLERQIGSPEFTPADINNCYYEAKIDSSNTSQMIIQNIRRGFMMLAKSKTGKNKKRYTLTSSGERFIETKMRGGGGT